MPTVHWTGYREWGVGKNQVDFAKINLDIFQGKDPGRVLWQPRIDYWYEVNKKRRTLPPHLQDASLLDV